VHQRDLGRRGLGILARRHFSSRGPGIGCGAGRGRDVVFGELVDSRCAYEASQRQKDGRQTGEMVDRTWPLGAALGASTRQLPGNLHVPRQGTESGCAGTGARGLWSGKRVRGCSSQEKCSLNCQQLQLSRTARRSI
jgi:hypothetical protein